MGRKKPTPEEHPSGPFNAAFASLEALKNDLEAPTSVESAEGVATPAPASAAEPPGTVETEPAAALAARGKIVVRRERKGHGGKTVTRIGGLGGEPEAVDALARTLARRLGVGVKVEDGEIWVQGDQTHRLQDLLQQLGARRVIAGN
jgi:translation initiation factor 1